MVKFPLSPLVPSSDPENGPDYTPLAHAHPTNGAPRRAVRWNIPGLLRNGSPTYIALALALLAGTQLGLSISSHRYRPELAVSKPSGSAYNVPLAYSPGNYAYAPDHEELSLEELREVVARANGYWARDYSLTLGWNNVRYIIETALLHGSLLNRTVILPSFVYARSCDPAHGLRTCSLYATQVNRSAPDWRNLPPDEQMAWRLPIGVMLDLPLLRRAQPVVTVAEYLRLHGIDAAAETEDGRWDEDAYHAQPGVLHPPGAGAPPTLDVVENAWYDPRAINRVDVLPHAMKLRGGWRERENERTGQWTVETRTPASERLEMVMTDRPRLEWDVAAQVLGDVGYVPLDISDEALEAFLEENGWEVLYTFNGAVYMDYVKNVVSPIRQVAPRHTLRGFVDDFGHLSADVVLLTGEIHYERKPGSLRFTAAAARDAFARLVLHRVRAPRAVYALAETLVRRIEARVGGRMWVGSHMRRGDFVRVDWAMEPTIEAHLERIQGRLSKGRELLRTLQHGGAVRPYEIPEFVANANATRLLPPHDDDPFYLATDERNATHLAHLAAHGALLPAALLTPADRQAFGWPLLFTDVLGLVEQAVLARAHYFYAHAMSSFSGGAINMRAVGGMDVRTAVVD